MVEINRNGTMSPILTGGRRVSGTDSLTPDSNAATASRPRGRYAWIVKVLLDAVAPNL